MTDENEQENSTSWFGRSPNADGEESDGATQKVSARLKRPDAMVKQDEYLQGLQGTKKKKKGLLAGNAEKKANRKRMLAAIEQAKLEKKMEKTGPDETSRLGGRRTAPRLPIKT